jgi:hypothetical protein
MNLLRRKTVIGIRVRERLFGVGLGSTICLCVALPGCSKDAVKVPALHPVTGTVTYKGQPVAGATVTFIADTKPPTEKERSSDKSAPQWAARCSGVADESGNYSLQWDDFHPGAPPGTYKVAITAVGTFEEGDDPDEPRKNAIPDKFGNPQTSGLTAKVEEGDNEINFDLKD